jgi:predicted ATPase
MRDALARHDQILHEAINGAGGRVFKTVGDAFCAVFSLPVQGLHASLAVQRAVGTEAWSFFGLPVPIQVRMALHAGVAESRDGDYFGPPLNRTARLLATGHGGQILLSAAAHALVIDHLPVDVALSDLGAYRLNNLRRPEQVYQVQAANLPSDFPPLRTLDAPAGNLPIQPTPLIGREREVAQLTALFVRDEVRLVTLTGPGGTGKTRLSLQIAADLRARFRDGVFFVDLAPITDPALVAPTIAQALGVPDTGNLPIPERLTYFLRARTLLLVLDNFEQVVEAAPLVAALLAAAAGLSVLVTSRIGLRLLGEHAYAVSPLALPPASPGLHSPDRSGESAAGGAGDLTQYAAVALFIARARAVKADFMVTNASAPAVAEICVRLDGLPLAIELAAARSKLFPPEALLARLRTPLALLTSGPRDLPARQQTIRATIDWSYQLLHAAEQRLFRSLGIFVGGFTLEAAEAIAAQHSSASADILDGVAALLDHSLIVALAPVADQPRYGMLELLREYALERLTEAGELDETRRRHAEYFVELAEAISAQGGEYEHWDDRTRIEYANLRVVLGWCRTAGPGGVPEADLGMRLARAVWLYWLNYDLYEGLHWLRELCGPAWFHGPPHLRARLHNSLGQYMGISSSPNDRSQALAVLDEGVRLSREIGDMWALAEACRHRSRASKNREEEVMWLAESLAAGRAADSPWNIAWTQDYFILVAIHEGNDQEAVRLCEECLPVFQQMGVAGGVAEIVYAYSVALLRLGVFERAAKLLDETLGSFGRDLNLHHRFLLYYQRGQVAYAQSDLWLASDLFVQALQIRREAAQQFRKADDLVVFQSVLGELAVVVAALGQHVHATHLLCHARDRLWYPQPNLVQAQIGASLAACRAALGEEAFDAAWAAGQAMTLDEAVTAALAFTADSMS